MNDNIRHRGTVSILFLIGLLCASVAAGPVIFDDDFQSYDVEDPADFSIGGVPTGNWTAHHDPGISRSNEIWNTGNFGGTRMWITIEDGAGITSKGLSGLSSNKDYTFSVVLVAETASSTRTVEVSYDLLIGQNISSATSVIGGPVAVTAHGDDWQTPDSKEDHVFMQQFTTGTLSPGDLLFVEIKRISSPDTAYLGVDDVRVAEVQPIEIYTSDTSLGEGDSSSITYDVYVKNEPTQPVTVTATADDQLLVNGQPVVTLIFNPPVNPSIPQSVTVTAIDDTVFEGTHVGLISHTSASVLPDYDGLVLPDVEVTISDDELPINFISNVFVGGQEGPDGTSNYRIPGMTVAPDGSILAFAEGRRNGGDPGGSLPIDMVMKRSTDNGQTWQPLVVLHHNNSFDYSDPRPITNMETGEVHLLYTQWPDLCGQGCVPVGLGDNSSVMYLQTSGDNGLTWSGPINLNSQVKDPAWRALNSGPGHGIQLRWQTNPAWNGRLLDPGHINGSDAVSVFSDDNGLTWKSGTVDITAPSLNESDVVELTNGDLLWDARPGGGLYRYRLKSTDGGQTWNYQGLGDIYITTVDCGIERYSAKRDGHDRDRILFSGPLGEPIGSASGRYNMAIWTSYDEGQSFTNPVQISNAFAAYSDIKRLADGTIGVIYEETGSTLIRLASCSIETLENGQHDETLTQYDGFGNAVDTRRGGVGWTGSWGGVADFNRSSNPVFGGSSIPFDLYRFTPQLGRVDSTDNGIDIVRTLSAPYGMDSNGAVYVSMLMSRVLDTSSDDSTGEDLNIEFRDNTDTAFISFGVDSEEAFFVEKPGNLVTTPNDTLAMSGTYFLIAKIITADDQAGQYDQIYLKAFESGTGSIPLEEVEVNWTLTGTADENSSAVLDRIAIVGGSQAFWSVDEVRIGTTYDSVAGQSLCSVPGTYLEADINRDCYVNLSDLALLMQSWLSCTDPGNPAQCN